MHAGLFALATSLLFVGALRLAGIAPYTTEFQSRPRRVVAFCLWVGILALVVFWPVSAPDGYDIDANGGATFALLFLNHLLLCVFLVLWWKLSNREPLARFLHLHQTRLLLRKTVALGLLAGLVGWAVTLVATGAFVAIWFEAMEAPNIQRIPEVFVWIAGLSAAQKAAIIAVAMTVEEAFFRAFLQPRLGLLLSSFCFALSHFSYQLPSAVFGVFVVSLFLGFLFRRTNHLLPSIVAHGVFDAVQLYLVLPWAVTQLGYPP